MIVVRPREAEDVGEVLQVLVVVGEALAADGGLVEPQGLDLRAHRAVENENPLVQERFEAGGLVDDGRLRHGAGGGSGGVRGRGIRMILAPRGRDRRRAGNGRRSTGPRSVTGG